MTKAYGIHGPEPESEFNLGECSIPEPESKLKMCPNIGRASGFSLQVLVDSGFMYPFSSLSLTM